MLTRKQLDLLEFIHKRLQKDGVPPSFDEMKEALDLRSKSGIHRLITALEERGFIRRLAHRARAIEILRLPESIEGGGFQPRIIEGSLTPPPAEALPIEAANALTLPIMGRIAAGTPIEAIQQVSNNVSVPGEMLKNSGRHYALEVKGDSMIEAGINEGDTVIIKRSDTADNGKIVVALIDEHEAMLKRIRRKGKTVALESANRNYETKIFGPDRVKVQGVLVSLYRNF